MSKKEQLKELVGNAFLKGYVTAVNDDYMMSAISKLHKELDKILENKWL